jgi:hypothetical protein
MAAVTCGTANSGSGMPVSMTTFRPLPHQPGPPDIRQER